MHLLQSRIELTVTNGLGYETRTNFLKSPTYGCTERWLLKTGNLFESDIKNTSAGLQAHLGELDLRRDLRSYVPNLDNTSSLGFFEKIKMRFKLSSTISKIGSSKTRAILEASYYSFMQSIPFMIIPQLEEKPSD